MNQMKAKARPAKSARRIERESADLSFGARNYAVLGAALASILIGFVLLSRGSITAAPVLLVLGYCILVPYGLATGRKTPPSGE